MPQPIHGEPRANLGGIGGTGLYQIEGMTQIQEVAIDTPFGKPSDSFIIGSLEGTGVAFLPRHGRGHVYMPSEIPQRANMYAFKTLGVEHIIAINSCGSYKEDIKPGDLVIPDQVIDRTTSRVNTFFGSGLVAHISFAEPFCPELSRILYNAGKKAGATVHRGGTFVTMEGPAFSTKAESRLYQSWGADIIGMTVLPEARLAREAEICYASIALVTDYDCWLAREKPVTVDIIISCMNRNVETAKQIIKLAVGKVPKTRKCECQNALKTAFVTAREKIPPELKRKLKPIIGRYIK
ncbi:MAG: S-methyl-5'-thioadenosine phosphorylase [Chloroflexota bacterium]